MVWQKKGGGEFANSCLHSTPVLFDAERWLRERLAKGEVELQKSYLTRWNKETKQSSQLSANSTSGRKAQFGIPKTSASVSPAKGRTSQRKLLPDATDRRGHPLRRGSLSWPTTEENTRRAALSFAFPLFKIEPQYADSPVTNKNLNEGRTNQ